MSNTLCKKSEKSEENAKFKFLADLEASISAIPLLQVIPDKNILIKNFLTKVEAEPDFDEAVSSYNQSLEQNKSKSINVNPDCRDIPNKITTGAKCKQNVLISDKAAEIAVCSQTITENKPQMLETGLSSTTELRRSTLHDTKSSRNLGKSVQTSVSEAKASSPNLNNTPVSKISNIPLRAMKLLLQTVNDLLDVKQNLLPESKVRNFL